MFDQTPTTRASKFSSLIKANLFLGIVEAIPGTLKCFEMPLESGLEIRKKN